MKRPSEQRTHGPQELKESSHLSLGRTAEPEWNTDFDRQTAEGKAFWTIELSLNKARSWHGTGCVWGPA